MSEMKKSSVTATEDFIPLIEDRPEIWDQFHPNYGNKSLKAQAWKDISAILGVPEKSAKLRWTNLRDFFRREIRKVLKKATETGDPTAYVPKWKNYENLMFLKDNVLRTMKSNVVVDSFSHSATGGGSEISFDEEEEFSDAEPDLETGPKRKTEMNGHGNPRKKISETNPYLEDNATHMSEDNENHIQENIEPVINYSGEQVDEDYHFLISLLPTFRKIRPDRKTNFKIKLFQLILEEERHAA